MCAAELPDLPPVTIVVVDDDSAVLAALAFSLEVEGFRVATFRSGTDLLAQRVFPQTGCLVLDFKLPDADGLQLLTALRSRQVNLPAILITSHPPPALRSRAAAAGVVVVEKPLLGNALSDAIHALLETPRTL